MSCDTELLDRLSKAFRAFSETALKEIRTYLLCQIANSDNNLQAPVLSAITIVSPIALQLDWTDSNLNETGVAIERDSGSGFVQIATVGAGVLTYLDSTLTPFTNYTYRVRAFEGMFYSPYSNEEAQQTPNTPAPVLSMTILTNTSIQLDWNDVIGESGFRLERSVNGGGFSEIIVLGTGVLTYTDGTPPEHIVLPGTQYAYRVRAIFSDYSNTVTGTTGSDWSDLVVTNGGAAPSDATIVAMETFRQGMVLAGLDTKMHSLCIFVPDSLTAAFTPIIYNKGSGLWVNNNFVSGDLTVEGLKGNGTTKYLDTTVMAKSGEAIDSMTGNCGLTLIVTESNSNAIGYEIGHQDNSSGDLALKLQASSVPTGKSGFTQNNSVADLYNMDFGRAGYLSGNNISSVTSVFTASPQESHAQFSTYAIATVPTASNRTIFAFAANEGGSAMGFSGCRMSMAAVHDGLTSSESATFWGLLQTLRNALGGGNGSRVTDWAAKIVRLGGSAPSGGTKTALNTFYLALNTAGIASKMVAANCFVPDSLDAARTPLFWRAGNEQWTNTNFISGDLTTAGLIGNGSNKYLATGITPAGSTLLSAGSGGLSVMLSVVPTVSNPADIGSAFDSTNVFNLLHQSGTAYFQAWKNVTSGTDYATGALPSGSWAGFLSGSRTATNAVALYRASTVNAFAAVVTGSGTSTGISNSTQAVTVFGYNVNGSGIVGYSDRRISFAAIHSGLSSSETQDLYNAVAALRTSLGGGNP